MPQKTKKVVDSPCLDYRATHHVSRLGEEMSWQSRCTGRKLSRQQAFSTCVAQESGQVLGMYLKKKSEAQSGGRELGKQSKCPGEAKQSRGCNVELEGKWMLSPPVCSQV